MNKSQLGAVKQLLLYSILRYESPIPNDHSKPMTTTKRYPACKPARFLDKKLSSELGNPGSELGNTKNPQNVRGTEIQICHC